MAYPVPPCFKPFPCGSSADALMIFDTATGSIDDYYRRVSVPREGLRWCTKSDYHDWLVKVCDVPWTPPVKSVKVEVTVYESLPRTGPDVNSILIGPDTAWFDRGPIVEAWKKLRGECSNATQTTNQP